MNKINRINIEDTILNQKRRYVIKKMKILGHIYLISLNNKETHIS